MFSNAPSSKKGINHHGHAFFDKTKFIVAFVLLTTITLKFIIHWFPNEARNWVVSKIINRYKFTPLLCLMITTLVALWSPMLENDDVTWKRYLLRLPFYWTQKNPLHQVPTLYDMRFNTILRRFIRSFRPVAWFLPGWIPFRIKRTFNVKSVRQN